MMPAISSRNGSAGTVGKRLDRAFEGRQVDGEARQDLTALGAAEIGRRQVLNVLEQALADVGDDAGGQPRVPALVPDRDDRGEDAGDGEHAEDLVQRLEVLLPERVVDQELEAERHDDVEQRLDADAKRHEGQHPLVVRQERLDEPDDGRERARGLARGKDDEVLVLIIVVELQLVIRLVFAILVVFEVRLGSRRELVVELGRLFGGELLFVGRERLGCHETNRC
ncbi:hypothetical protein ABH978_004377 [Bradyrhizobium ottawaense]